MPKFPSPRIQNRLVNLNFAGWRSNTYELQQNGWEIAVQENHATYSMRIAIKHPPTGLYGITQNADHCDMKFMEDMQRHSGIELFVVAMRANLLAQTPIKIDMNDFNPVDARPYVNLEPIQHIDDFNIFRPLAKGQEIIIPDESVSELLERIHKLQDPKQEEIRLKRQKELRRQMHKCNEEVNNYDLGVNIVVQVATLV